MKRGNVRQKLNANTAIQIIYVHNQPLLYFCPAPLKCNISEPQGWRPS